MLKINKSIDETERRGIVRTGVDFNSFRNTDQEGRPLKGNIQELKRVKKGPMWLFGEESKLKKEQV